MQAAAAGQPQGALSDEGQAQAGTAQPAAQEEIAAESAPPGESTAPAAVPATAEGRRQPAATVDEAGTSARTREQIAAMDPDELEKAHTGAVEHNNRAEAEFVQREFGADAAQKFAQMGRRAREKWLNANLTTEQDDALQATYQDESTLGQYVGADGDFDDSSPEALGQSIMGKVKDMGKPGWQFSPEGVTVRNALDFATQQGWSEAEVLDGVRSRIDRVYGNDAAEMFPRFYQRRTAQPPANALNPLQKRIAQAKAKKAAPALEQPETTPVDEAAHAAATSPKNDLPDPSEAQKESGNYTKGHVKLHGLDISIENPKGSTRSGKRPDGSTWSHQMGDHYGYIRRSTGADGEQVDVYVGPKPDSAKVFVIDQLNQKTGGFDEAKVMMGYDNQLQAVIAYRKNFDKSWKVGPVTAMTVDEFKTWLKDGDTTKPMAPVKPTAPDGDVVSTFIGKFKKGMGKDAAKLEAARLNKAGDGISYTAEEHGDPKLENPYAVVGRKVAGAAPVPREAPAAKPVAESPPASSASDAFIAAPNGSTDFGEITAEMGKAMRRQAGKIRLQEGNALFGLRHIEKRHGDQIRAAGFASVEAFVEDTARHIDQVLKPDSTSQLVAVRKTGTDQLLYIELRPAKDDAGDYYTVRTAFPARQDFVNRKGWKMLWEGRAQPSPPAASEQAPFAVPPKIADKAATNPSGQSGAIVPPADPIQQAEAKPAAPATKPGEVENFGEALPPARRNMAAKLDEALSDDDIAKRPLSEIWPLAENQAIEEAFPAAVAHAARAEVPAKPRVAYKLKRWVEKVKTVRELAGKIVSGRITREQFIEKTSVSLKDWVAKVLLLEQIPRDQWGRVESVEERPDSVTYKDGKQLPAPHLSIRIDGRSHWLTGDKGAEGDARGTLTGNMEGIRGLLGAAAPEERMQFEIRRPRAGGKFFVNKKGDGEYRRLMEFDTAEEARKAITDQYNDLVSAWDAIKARDNITERDLRSAENRPRVGKDHRSGRDVTPEDFQSQFGFRGGEFGKWVQQGKGEKERQAILNGAYDALMDLADITGIPPKAISLNGTLGIAFGSRGTGWASAHFEPSNLVINLTKTRGAGALAHEWLHAVDNYFGRMRRGGEESKFTGNQADYRNQNYITHRPEALMVPKNVAGGRYLAPMTLGKLQAMHEASKDRTDAYNSENWQRDPKTPEGVRPEVEARFAALVDALNQSPMAQRARKLDGIKSGDGYWSRTLEMAARAFENYVAAKMHDDGYTTSRCTNSRRTQNCVCHLWWSGWNYSRLQPG